MSGLVYSISALSSEVLSCRPPRQFKCNILRLVLVGRVNFKESFVALDRFDVFDVETWDDTFWSERFGVLDFRGLRNVLVLLLLEFGEDREPEVISQLRLGV